MEDRRKKAATVKPRKQVTGVTTKSESKPSGSALVALRKREQLMLKNNTLRRMGLLSSRRRDGFIEAMSSVPTRFQKFGFLDQTPSMEVSVADLSASWLSMNLPTTQIASVMELANTVFEDREIAKDWLNDPNIATDNKPPIALLGTDEGLLRVETLLHRIESGVLA